MTPERWKKIEDIFQDALDLTGAARRSLIAEKTSGDAELRAEVEKLIARFEREEKFLESPVWTDSRVLGETLKGRVADSIEDEISQKTPTENSLAGRKIGVYRLTEQIGRGGMGVVYAAERDDGEFKQTVAVKLIKRGMDTDFIVKRFRHERQILANLSHPNIARLLDGGTTTDGSPYFVMEFIAGEPILEYCARKNLDLRRRLELFLEVCTPVIYAHRRKIIHRDIKPSNILVTEEGAPKLLDFGIAKILESDSIDESIAPTATAMRLMTPEYASPEQVRGEEITPASDQYSLGVLLYELLTGERPYKFPSRAPHEIARVICEEIPSEPSSGSFGSATAEDFAFSADFGKNLDRIALKTLRKNPAERYDSVEDFAADIERFLNNEPVQAETFTKQKNKTQSPISVRRKGIKQGFFLILLSVLLLPVYIVLIVTDIIPPEITVSLFFIMLFGGIIRAGYALLFESGTPPAPDSESKKTISARRKGIKQGIFLVALFVVCIPFFNIVIEAKILPAPVMTVIFLLIFFGGIVRVLYALLLQDAKIEAVSPEVRERQKVDAGTKSIKSDAPRDTIAANQTTNEKTDETREKSIAVLPFKILASQSADAKTDDAEFLSIGLADALIVRFSNVRQFIVRPTNSVLRFAGDAADAFAAGEDLKVAYVLTGNILRAAGKIRVSVQLLDVREQTTVWAERFEEEFTNVLKIEDSISRRVAESVMPRMSGDERRRLEKRGTDSPEAYEAYLRGRFHWNNFTQDSFRQAISFYKRAIELDPNFALAYAGIADYHIWLGVYGVLPTNEFYPAARDAARRAIALDAHSSEAHAALGLARFYGEYDWLASETDLRRAVEINPHNSVAHLWFSHILFAQKRFDEGRRHLEKALALDPFSFQHHNTMAWSYYFSRDYEKALAEAERLVEQFPAVEQARFSRVCFLNFAGQTDEAEREMQRAANISNDPFFINLGFAQIRAAEGNRRAVEELIKKTNAGERKFSNYYLALFYSYLRDKDTAFDYLERARADRESLLVWVGIEPSFDFLREDERYENLLFEVNPLLHKTIRQNEINC